MQSLDLKSILLVLPGIIIGLTVHEFAHAFAAYKLGDETAKQAGRVTLNPLKHIDPLGFMFMIIAGFGWAKPVQFNPANLENRKRDEIIISLAGPLTNLVMGLIFFAIARLLFIGEFFNATDQGINIINFVVTCGALNFGLFVFNMIPLPPLDGSHLYLAFLQEINPPLMDKLYRYGSLILLAIILFQNRAGLNLLPIGDIVNFMAEKVIDWLRFYPN